MIAKPGGDKIGRRRLDTHFLGIQKLGADFRYDPAAKRYEIVAPHLKGCYMRLRKESLHFRIHDKNIAQLAEMDVTELSSWLNHVDKYLDNKQRTIATEILKELRSRLQFLLDVGLGYLSLNRASHSLSGGESQRIRLATQIGSQLVNVLYILDEPSIGLHQRDNMVIYNLGIHYPQTIVQHEPLTSSLRPVQAGDIVQNFAVKMTSCQENTENFSLSFLFFCQNLRVLLLAQYMPNKKRSTLKFRNHQVSKFPHNQNKLIFNT